MSLSNDTRDKISPKPLWRNSLTILTWAIIAVQIVVAIIVFPLLPPVVPIHWDANGQPNGYGSKWIATALLPLMSIGLYILMRALMAMGPRLGSRESAAANIQLRNMLVVAIVLFMLIVQLVTSALTLGLSIDAPLIIGLGLAVLFMFLGNYLGKMRRNFWMGIRTPWTLSSDITWERTHRVGGWLFVAVGLLSIPLSFVPGVRLFGIVVLSLLASVFLYIYSYICYRQSTPGDPDFPAHPFEEARQE